MPLPPPPAQPIIEYVQPRCAHVEAMAALVASLTAKGVRIVTRDVTIAANLAQAKQLGVPGTPSVVVDGQVYAGDQAVERLKLILAGLSRQPS